MVMEKQADAKTPGQWLRAARRNAGLTQEEVARALKVVSATISAYENGRIRRVDEQYVPTLARLLGKGIVETRRGLGLFVPEDMAQDEYQPPSVLEAILADPDLRDDFKQHISAQYKILRDATLATRAPSESTAEMLGRKLEQQERAESGLSQDRPTPNY